MDHYCDKCVSKIKLIKKSEKDFGCPSCHSQFELENNKLIRTAQFGGNIAKPTMTGPGSSPLFKGLSNKSRGTNTRFETSFDTIISRTHNPAPLDPERNMEKRLEQFHVQAEDDQIPYELDIKERTKLKIKKEIRRREKFYQDAANRIDQNSVKFIKDNFKPNEDQMQGIEQSLATRRKYEKTKEKSIAEDVAHEQIKPERRHAAKNTITTTVFDNTISDSDAEMLFNPEFLTVGPFEGVYGGTLLTNSELDKYLDTENFDLGLFINKTTNAFDYPELDDYYSTAFLSSDLPSKIQIEFDPEEDTIETALRNEIFESPTIENLPQIKAPEDVNRDKNTEEGREPRSIFEKYPKMPVDTTPLPKSGLK